MNNDTNEYTYLPYFWKVSMEQFILLHMLKLIFYFVNTNTILAVDNVLYIAIFSICGQLTVLEGKIRSINPNILKLLNKNRRILKTIQEHQRILRL